MYWAEKLHFTVANWPAQVPVPHGNFDPHDLDSTGLLALLGSFLHDKLGSAYEDELKQISEAKKGKGKARETEELEDIFLPKSATAANICLLPWPEGEYFLHSAVTVRLLAKRYFTLLRRRETTA